ncbi:MAG: pitrilysin family protein [Chitinophagaceae bacterium]
MKKLFITITGCLLLVAAMGQVNLDRSKRPKPGPAPVISFKDAVVSKLTNGITILVVENHKLPKVSATYSIDMGPVTEGAKTGTLSLMGQMLNEGTTTKTKAEFDEAVDQIGANVGLSAGGGSASALTRYFDKAFALMADGLLHPSFPQESFGKLKSQILTGLKASEKSAKAISGNVVPAITYGLDHPFGEFETEATINSITMDDIKKAYAAYITPSRGYLTFVGDITPAQAKALAEKTLGSWKGNALTFPSLKAVANPAKTEIDIVDVPNAVQSEITVTNLVSLPMSHPDYFPVLLANQILGGGGEARLFMNLRERHGFTYGSYSNIAADRFQSRFSATASVRNDKTDSAVAEILHEIDTMQIKKVSAEELKNTKALYNGSFALGLENPARTAGFASNILIHGLPKDFYRTYLQKINAVTADDIQRVAKKYFSYANTRVVVVGKQEQVLPGLKALGHPVKFFDKYAMAVSENTSTVQKTDVTAAQIVDNYARAIGGKDALGKVKTIVSTGNMEVMGTTLPVTIKEESPNKESMVIAMAGQTVMKSVFDGSTGYQAQMGQKQPMSDEEIAEKKITKGLFQQLFYASEGYKTTVKGIEKLAGGDAYVLIVTSPGGSVVTEYYDVKTSFLVKKSETKKEAGTEMTETTEYADYKQTGDLFLPHKLIQTVATPMGNQEFVITLSSVKVNEAVSPDDFK